MIKWWFGYSDTYMPLLALLVYIVLWKRIDKREMILFFYLIFCFLVFGMSNVLGTRRIHNLFLYHLFSLGELLTIAYYIIRVVLKKKPLYFWLIASGYSVFFVVNIVLWESLDTFNSNSAALSNLILLILAMYYMLQLSKSKEILHFQKLPSFWIVSAFLIYCSVSALVLIVYKSFAGDTNAEGIKVWTVMLIAAILKFVFLSVGLLCYKRPHIQDLSLS